MGNQALNLTSVRMPVLFPLLSDADLEAKHMCTFIFIHINCDKEVFIISYLNTWLNIKSRIDAKFCWRLFRIYGDDCMILLLRSSNMVSYANGFLILNLHCIPGINHTEMYCSFLKTELLDSICWYFNYNFALMFISEICLKFSFLCSVIQVLESMLYFTRIHWKFLFF